MRRCMGLSEREIERLTGISLDSVRNRVFSEIEGKERAQDATGDGELEISSVSSAERNRRALNKRKTLSSGRSRRFHRRIWYLAVIVFLLICIGTAVFAVNIDFRKNYFGEGSDKVNNSSALRSLENGDIRYTVEDTISDGDTLIIVYSVEGLSDTGKIWVDSGDFLFGPFRKSGAQEQIHLSFESDEKDEEEQTGFDSIIITPLTEYSTENHRFYQIIMEFTGNCDVKTWLEGCDEVLEIPVDLNPESMEFDIAGKNSDTGETNTVRGSSAENGWEIKKVRITKVKMSMDVAVTMEYSSQDIDFFAEHVSFIYKDGTVKNTKEMLNDSNHSSILRAESPFSDPVGEKEANEKADYTLKGHFWDIPDFDQIEGILVDGVKYPAER